MPTIRRPAGGLAAAAIATTVAAVSALTTVLNFPYENPAQEHSQWCWAGSGQAMLAYYGTTVSQCAIANYATGYPGVAGRPDCCIPSGYSAGEFQTSGCNNWNYLWGSSTWGVPGGSLQGILSHWGVSSSTVGSSLAADIVAAEIDAGRPMVMRFGWKTNGSLNGSGHFLDIYGYAEDGAYLDYWNPLPGWGATRSLYGWVADGSDHQWTHTLRMTTDPPANPPAFVDDPLRPRITPVRAVHITDLREKIDALRARYRLSAFAWSDPVPKAGDTGIRAIHVAELRTALADVFAAAGRSQPAYTTPTLQPGATVITAAQISEIRTAIVGLW